MLVSPKSKVGQWKEHALTRTQIPLFIKRINNKSNMWNAYAQRFVWTFNPLIKWNTALAFSCNRFPVGQKMTECRFGDRFISTNSFASQSGSLRSAALFRKKFQEFKAGLKDPSYLLCNVDIIKETVIPQVCLFCAHSLMHPRIVMNGTRSICR